MCDSPALGSLSPKVALLPCFAEGAVGAVDAAVGDAHQPVAHVQWEVIFLVRRGNDGVVLADRCGGGRKPRQVNTTGNQPTSHFLPGCSDTAQPDASQGTLRNSNRSQRATRSQATGEKASNTWEPRFDRFRLHGTCAWWPQRPPRGAAGFPEHLNGACVTPNALHSLSRMQRSLGSLHLPARPLAAVNLLSSHRHRFSCDASSHQLRL